MPLVELVDPDRVALVGHRLGEPLAEPRELVSGGLGGRLVARDGALVLTLRGPMAPLLAALTEVVGEEWDFESKPTARRAVRRHGAWRVEVRWGERAGAWQLGVTLAVADPWPTRQERRAARAEAQAGEARALLDRLFRH